MPATRSRLKSRYEEEIRPALIERFGYTTPMQAPVIRKITLNMGVGDAKQDSKVLEAATDQLATIAGQRPSVRRARKSIAAFKLREGMPVGVSVTLRGERSYEFLDRLMSVAIPRIRDFRGMNPRAFDGRGNYSMGVREQIIFPEIDYDAIDQTRGLNITITTSAGSDAEAFALLEALGFPFAREEGAAPPGPVAAASARERSGEALAEAVATAEVAAEELDAADAAATEEAPASEDRAGRNGAGTAAAPEPGESESESEVAAEPTAGEPEDGDAAPEPGESESVVAAEPAAGEQEPAGEDPQGSADEMTEESAAAGSQAAGAQDEDASAQQTTDQEQ
jgi:large subunit ribosomal protein L5